MKKIVAFAALFLATMNVFAAKIKITAEGDKTGPTTVSPNGACTFNCNPSTAVCASVIIETAYQIPQFGDPTTITTYSQNQVDAEVSGQYVSHSIVPEQNGTVTYTINLILQ